jgi:lipid II:glycine glycyltransferase (peptidoglycan interpeptide bridge formation enzyme)/dTDP-4-amino-4,6-dideoxygalactose transaminase
MINITLSPLPSMKVLMKSIFIKIPKNRKLAKPWLLRSSDIPYWFSRSAISMTIIAKWWIEFTDNKKPNIWIPDYFCNESIQFLRDANYKLHFYPITEQFQPDWNACRVQAAIHKPDIFIIVHYFGAPSEGKKARGFCNNHECVLVEDAAHVLIPYQDIGIYGEFILYSPHKLIAIPDGSVLIQKLKTKVTRKLSDKNPVDVMNQIMETLPQKSPSPVFWLFKRILQKFLPNYFWLKKRQNGNPTKDILFKSLPFKPLQSKMSQKLLTAQILHINKYGHIRQVNQTVLRSFFSSYLENANNSYMQNNDFVPYFTGLQCHTAAGEFFKLLRGKHLPVMKWPDLPPEVISDPDNHRIALKLEKTFLFFPIHQSLKISDIKKIGFFFKNKMMNNPSENGYQIEWFKGEKEEWDNWVRLAGKSNLMQTWSYGEAKKKVEAWEVKRGLIKKNDHLLAIFQALEKSWGPFGVIRINRGPLLINAVDNFETKYNIYKTLRKTWMWWKGRSLIIAPDLVNMPENSGVLELANFRKRPAKPWRSSLIDLSLTESDIRKNLNGKWRNQLKKSELSGIEIINDKSDNSFFELLNNYKQMMKDKSFEGPSIELYNALQQVNNDNHFIFQVKQHNQIIASILILQHGASCTYQIGWNSSNGRKIYANNFLLWNAILEMKKHGCLWFDLGGIDEENTPGITKFKRGLEGKEYTLVGEWISG